MRALLLLLTAALCCAATDQAEQQQQQAAVRRMLIRPTPEAIKLGSGTCRNTGQGVLLITDERGVVCSREEVDSGTGCCKAGSVHTCGSCKLEDKCCSDFEGCVSCCLAPKHEAAKISTSTLRFPSYPKAGHYTDAWDFCTGVCRTHKGSTEHENAYISERHHCFSKVRKPWLSEPLPPGTLEGVTMVMSSIGHDCDQACSRVGKKCSARLLKTINSCDQLRESSGCEAGCEAAEQPTRARAAPSYVQPKAPKANRPAMCFTAKPEHTAFLQCVGKESDVQRLCPCELRDPKWDV